MSAKTILFLCVENACRSLMAESIFNADPPPGWRAISAGTRPSPRPNPRTGPMLAELGLSPPSHPPQAVTTEMLGASQVRILMGCLDPASCPVQLGGSDVRDWALPDPSPLDDAGFREVRDRLVSLVRSLRDELMRAERSNAARLRGRSR